jgi:DNA-binding NtrC family response regulator
MAKVLIADDSDLDRELTSRALRKAAPEVTKTVCEDGEQALAAFIADEEIQLILLDHRMPKMGAEEFLAAAPPERLKAVTIILFSSAVSPLSVDKAMQMGVHTYVEKPTDPTDYNLAVRRIVEEYLPVGG